MVFEILERRFRTYNTISKIIEKRTEVDLGRRTTKSVWKFKESLALTEAPILASPDFSKPVKVQSDASSYAIRSVLTQEEDDGEHPIIYASRVLN